MYNISYFKIKNFIFTKQNTHSELFSISNNFLYSNRVHTMCNRMDGVERMHRLQSNQVPIYQGGGSRTWS